MFDVRTLFAALRRPAPETAFARATIALDRGDFATALAELHDAATDAGGDAERAVIANKCGVVQIGLGNRDAALSAFDRALGFDERCAPALANLGNLLFEDRHIEDAIDYYRAAIRADEAYAIAHQNLGIALKTLGRHGEAVRSLRTASRLAGKRRV